MNNGYISSADVATLNNLPEEYFPEFNGYISNEAIKYLGSLKGFALGYTYRILKEDYDYLLSAEQKDARRFFYDIESNAWIGSVTIDIGYASGRGNLYLLGNPDAISNSDIQRLTTLFTNRNSAFNKDIDAITAKVFDAVSADIYGAISSAIHLNLLVVFSLCVQHTKLSFKLYNTINLTSLDTAIR